MLSRNLEHTLHHALALATERSHEFATLEHLLLSLTDDQDARSVMKACGVDNEQLAEDVTNFLDVELDDLHLPHDSEPKPTAGFQRVRYCPCLIWENWNVSWIAWFLSTVREHLAKPITGWGRRRR